MWNGGHCVPWKKWDLCQELGEDQSWSLSTNHLPGHVDRFSCNESVSVDTQINKIREIEDYFFSLDFPPARLANPSRPHDFSRGTCPTQLDLHEIASISTEESLVSRRQPLSTSSPQPPNQGGSHLVVEHRLPTSRGSSLSCSCSQMHWWGVHLQDLLAVDRMVTRRKKDAFI